MPTREPEDDPFEHCRRLVAEACRRPAAERAAFLDAACGGDAELRADVQEMLALAQKLGGDDVGKFLEQAEEADTKDFLGGSSPGSELRQDGSATPIDREHERIGPYRLVGRLGEGGMAVVYEAEQDRPKRRVALKVLRTALPSAGARKRLEREAEFLASLDHPGIARIYDAGIDERAWSGMRPWIAMELVQGEPLTRHVKRVGATRQRRVELLRELADAVAHAHSRGIVHRDLKPANVLVDARGAVRVLDFGVARAVTGDSQGGDESAALTRTGDIVGTLAYMSPEQASGRITEVSPASDVHALGIIAFELLTGTLPHQLEGLPLPRALARVAEGDVERLSSIDPALRGDLEAIVTKCLEREPHRRYANAGELAEDLARHLADEPIRARHLTLTDHVARFARRHRALVAVTVGIVAALAITVAVVARMALREAQSKRVAQENEALAESRSEAARASEYRARLVAASAALNEGNVEAARAQLDRAPEDLRGWEWRQLASRLDASIVPGLPRLSEEAPRPAFRADGTLILTDGARVVAVGPEATTATTLLDARPGTVVVALSDDGRRAVLRSDDMRTLVSLDDLTHSRRLESPRQGEPFFSNGAVVATDGGADVVIDPDTGAVLARLPAELRGRIVEWFPLTREVLHLSEAKPRVITLRDTRGRVLSTLPPPAFAAEAVPQTTGPPFDSRIAATADGGLIAWVAQGFQVFAWRRGERDPAAWAGGVSVAITPNGERAVVSDENGRVALIDVASARMVAQLSSSSLQAWRPRPPAASSQGDLVALAGVMNSVQIVDVREGRMRATLLGHAQSVAHAVFSPDGTRLVTTDESGDARLWLPSDDHLQGVLRGHDSYVYGVVVTADGSTALSGAWDGTIRTWSLPSGEPERVLPTPAGDTRFGHLDLSPDGRWLASVHGSNVTTWNAQSLEPISSMALKALIGPRDYPYFDARLGGIAWMSSRRLVMAGTDREARLYDVDEAGRLSDAGTWPIKAAVVAADPQGGRAAAGVNSLVEVREAEGDRLVIAMKASSGQISALAFSPDGTRLAIGGFDGRVEVREVADGTAVWSSPPLGGLVYALAWHPDGKLLASGGGSGIVNLWDAATGDELVPLRGHGAYVHALRFTPDGRQLISGSGDSTLRLWDTVPAATRWAERVERAAAAK